MVKEHLEFAEFRYSSGKTIILRDAAAAEWQETYERALAALIEKVAKEQTAQRAATTSSTIAVSQSLRDAIGTPTKPKE